MNFDKAEKKVVFENRLPSGYFLTSDDMTELFIIAQDSLWDALCKAFYAGVVEGNRATLTHNLKRM